MNSRAPDPPLILVSCVIRTFTGTSVCRLDYGNNNQRGVIYFMDAMEMLRVWVV